LPRILALALAALALVLAACGDDSGDGAAATGTGTTATTAPRPSGGELTIYSGRNEELVGPLIERFERETGTDAEVRYGDSAELAATLLEEGDRSPADVFFSQDAGALGALQNEGRLTELDRALVRKVRARFRSAKDDWVGTSARARIVAYDKRELQPADMPRSVLGFTDSEWKGKLGWAPTNASFQAFVTALRVTRGEDAARRWLEGIKDNDVQSYENNIAVRDAIANGEIQAGFINHYYVAEAVAEQGADYPVGIYQPPNGDIGSLVNVAGAGVLKSTKRPKQAEAFVRFLLGREAQEYFAEETKEYPIADGVKPPTGLTPLDDIEQPKVDLARLADLQGTVRLLQDTGVL
jgi:iron(III) transport system substrate-binding protein